MQVIGKGSHGKVGGRFRDCALRPPLRGGDVYGPDDCFGRLRQRRIGPGGCALGLLGLLTSSETEAENCQPDRSSQRIRRGAWRQVMGPLLPRGPTCSRWTRFPVLIDPQRRIGVRPGQTSTAEAVSVSQLRHSMAVNTRRAAGLRSSCDTCIPNAIFAPIGDPIIFS